MENNRKRKNDETDCYKISSFDLFGVHDMADWGFKKQKVEDKPTPTITKKTNGSKNVLPSKFIYFKDDIVGATDEDRELYLKTLSEHDELIYAKPINSTQTAEECYEDNKEEDNDDDIVDLSYIMQHHKDIYYCNRDHEKAAEYRKIVCSHVAKYIKEARDNMSKNDEIVKEQGKHVKGVRDRGFYRCRVLIVVPFRHAALEYAKTLRKTLKKDFSFDTHLKTWKKFQLQFNEVESDDEAARENNSDIDDEEDLIEELTKTEMKKQRAKSYMQNRQKVKAQKEIDAKKTNTEFDEWTLGNRGEKFAVGINITDDKMMVNVPFTNSDIVIASPLYLNHIFNDKQGQSTELLLTRSVEIFVMDQMEYMLFQNPANILNIVNRLNRRPQYKGENRNLMNDLLRVHLAHLKDKAAMFRQNIYLSSINHSFFNKLMEKHTNFYGYKWYGPWNKKVEPCKQKSHVKFQTITVPIKFDDDEDDSENEDQDIKDDNEERLKTLRRTKNAYMNTFHRKVIPTIITRLEVGVLVYCVDDSDIYRVAALLKTNNLSYVEIVGNMTEDAVEKAMGLFSSRRVKVLLLSERYYAIARPSSIGATNHIVYLSAPSCPRFAGDLHASMLKRSQVTEDKPHHVIALRPDGDFGSQLNFLLAFSGLYGV